MQGVFEPVPAHVRVRLPHHPFVDVVVGQRFGYACSSYRHCYWNDRPSATACQLADDYPSQKDKEVVNDQYLEAESH